MGQVLCSVDVVSMWPGPSTTEQFLALLHLVLQMLLLSLLYKRALSA